MSDTASTLTRREVLAAMAATAGAFMIPRPAEATQAFARVARELSATGAYSPKVYTPHEWATVTLLVDLVIPKDAVSGSATDAAVPEFMDTMLDLEPDMRTAHRGGLAWLDDESDHRFGKDFVTITDGQRREILDDISHMRTMGKALLEPHFASLVRGAEWFMAFRAFTATGFFTSEMGVKDLGYQGNTALPEWTGCPVENYQRLGVKKP